ncbi:MULTISPECIES: GTPase [Acinetobacter]|uniref:GTPase n=1 Tax=Acinetobacter TaxID=469 RepID=UPI0015D19993|nr:MULTISPECIES: GTPase [Acinetobacter]UNT63671.1 50S ribosome-binding GTPase [Acinetobacter towneri]
MSASYLLKESQDLRKYSQDFLNQSLRSEKPVIVTWGLMNAGKSSLLNMLTQHIEQEFFKTNDFRETTEVSAYEGDQYIYLDTPGLDANTADNLEALKGIKKADIVLFVHQLQGELEANEVEFLKDVRTSFGQYAEKNIILILSKVDKEDRSKVDQIQKRVLEQCEQYLGFQPQCFQISNKLYQQGIQKHKDGLVRHSHIEDLKQCINSIVSNTRVVRQERLNQEKALLLKKLTEQKTKIEAEHQVQRSLLMDGFVSFQRSLKSLKQFVETKAQQYKNI